MKKRNKISFIALAAGLLVAGILLLAFLAPSGTGPRFNGTSSLRVGSLNDFSAISPYYLAVHEGYFKDDGLKVNEASYEAGANAVSELLSGKVDVAFATDYALAARSFDHPELRILASMSLSDFNVLVAHKGSGIEKQADVKGKRIAVGRGTSAEYGLGRFLLDQGLGIEQVEIVDIAPEKIPAAFNAHEVDAAMTWAPYLFEIERAGGAELLEWPESNIPSWYFLVITTEQQARQNRDALTRLLNGLQKAEEFIERDRAKAMGIVHEMTGLPASYLDSAWRDTIFQLSLPQELLTSLDGEARWIVENSLRQKTEIPNFLSYLATGPLLSVNPKKMTVFR